jgi:hypothetical protein
LNFEIYYAGEVIGYIKDGAMDEGVRETFWKNGSGGPNGDLD